jgi:hypothetical protein
MGDSEAKGHALIAEAKAKLQKSAGFLSFFFGCVKIMGQQNKGLSTATPSPDLCISHDNTIAHNMRRPIFFLPNALGS